MDVEEERKELKSEADIALWTLYDSCMAYNEIGVQLSRTCIARRDISGS